jgi:hypothetical protein
MSKTTPMKIKRLLPTRKEIELLRELTKRVGVTKLAKALDISFTSCKSLVSLERVTEHLLQHVRDRLPKVAAEYLHAAPQSRKKVPRARTSVPLQQVDNGVRKRLLELLPYVSMVRLSQALGFSTKTLRAVMAGYRPLHASTQDEIRSQLDELLQPPHRGLRVTLATTTLGANVKLLQDGHLAPIPGMTVAETITFLSTAARAQ